jgi:hypothetical protein
MIHSFSADKTFAAAGQTGGAGGPDRQNKGAAALRAPSTNDSMYEKRFGYMFGNFHGAR